jgi:hypothetical protein
VRLIRIPPPILLLILQLPLIHNPGWFSQDENRMARTRADAPSWSVPPWAAALDLTPCVTAR